MPKVSIREIDKTGSEAYEFLNHTVLMLGAIVETTPEESGVEKVSLDGLYTSLDEFNTRFAEIVVEESGERAPVRDDLGFLMTCELLKAGLTVQYKGAYEFVENGGAVVPSSDPEYWSKLFKEFEDKGKYDLRFIAIGGIADDDGKIGAEAIRCAGNRGDCVALININTAQYKNTDAIEEWLKSEQNAITVICNQKIERQGTSWTVRPTDLEAETYGRYASIFAPWVNCKVFNEKTFKYESKALPASFIYLNCYARFVSRYNEWFAMAGSVRGVSSYEFTPEIIFGDSDVDILQVRGGEANEGHIAVNVIQNVRPYGYIVWGNRTAQPLGRPYSEDGTLGAIQLVASSFLNIRHLCSTIKKTLYRASRQFTFEPNNDVLWFNFKSVITPILEKMKTNQGIDSYKIVKVPTNKKALLVARIIITPVESVEDFDLTVELTDSVEVTE